jgi:hypothetical protein
VDIIISVNNFFNLKDKKTLRSTPADDCWIIQEFFKQQQDPVCTTKRQRVEWIHTVKLSNLQQILFFTFSQNMTKTDHFL